MRKLIPYQQEKLAREMAKDYERAKNKKIEETDPKEIKKVLFKKSTVTSAKKRKQEEEEMKKNVITEVVFVMACLVVIVVAVIFLLEKMPLQKVVADVPMTQPTPIDTATTIDVVVVKKHHHHHVVVVEVPTAVPTVVPVRGIYVFNKFAKGTVIEVVAEDGHPVAFVQPRHLKLVTYDGHAGMVLTFVRMDCQSCGKIVGSEDFSDGKTWVVRFSSTDSPYLKTEDLLVLPPQKKG